MRSVKMEKLIDITEKDPVIKLKIRSVKLKNVLGKTEKSAQ
jgi:hypothetical protein